MRENSEKAEKWRKIKMYEMLEISAEKYAKNCVHNILDKEKNLWLKNKDIGKEEGVKNAYDLIDKEIKDKLEPKNPTN